MDFKHLIAYSETLDSINLSRVSSIVFCSLSMMSQLNETITPHYFSRSTILEINYIAEIILLGIVLLLATVFLTRSSSLSDNLPYHFMNTYTKKIKTRWLWLPIKDWSSLAIAIPLTWFLGIIMTSNFLHQSVIGLQIYIDQTNQVLINSQDSLISLIIIGQIETEQYRLLDLQTKALQEQNVINAHAMWYGVSISMIGTAITIQLLRQLDRELRQQEARLRLSRNLIAAIGANIVDGVMIVKAQGQIEMVNDAARQMFGYDPVEVLGLPWQTLIPQTTGANLLVETLEGEAPPIDDHRFRRIGKIWQTMGQHKNRDWFPVELSINPIRLDDKLIIIVRDITERQQAAAKLKAKAVELAELNSFLNASNDSLRRHNRELDQFAYITSHDLKAPLRAIASLSEWIQDDLGDAISGESRSHMNLLRRRVYRMQALLNSLLEYSRAGRKRAPISLVNVAHLLADVIQTLAPPDTFTINILAPMPTINTRRDPLHQVFTHLIDNAIRHHPTKSGIIGVSVIDKGDKYEFSIADNGDGIDVRFHEKIYIIFQTLKPRDLTENIGAGLATIQKIVIAEGGNIQLDSTIGRGAIFRFTWLKQAIIDNHPNHA